MADRSYIYAPIDDHTVLKPTGVLLGRFSADVGYRNMGNYESCSLTIEKEEEEIWSPQTPVRSKISTSYDEVQVNLSFVMQQVNDLTRAAVMQSEPRMVFAQTAQAAKAFAFEDVEAGMILPLGYRQLTDLDLPVAWVEGVHYQFDAAAGHLEVLKFPDGAPAGDVTGTFSAAAIAGRKVWGVASQLDLRGAIIFRSTNPRRNGPRQLAEFWNVGLSGDGEVPLGANSSDQGSVTVMGKVYADPRQEEAFQYGRITDLPA